MKNTKFFFLSFLGFLFLNSLYALAQDTVKEGGQSGGEIIMSLENSAMERWRTGDPWGWAEISDKNVIYTDPGLTKPIEGIEAYKNYLQQFEGKINYQVSEFINPKVKRYGDLAVLTYNYRDAKKNEDGVISDQYLWNTTEVYLLKNGEWKIIHTHWSFISNKLPEQVEVPVLVTQPKIEYKGVLREIMKLESAAMERWRKGDPWGFTNICDRDVTYFDTGTLRRIDGLTALKSEYAKRVGKIYYDVMEFIDPKVQVYGDAAVLFYRFFSTQLNPDGSIASRTPWEWEDYIPYYMTKPKPVGVYMYDYMLMGCVDDAILKYPQI